jgi:ACR3 family arsenite efflux pump ArsB
MDPNPHEPSKLDERARRARALIVILMAVFIAAPLVMYLLAGNGSGPRR